MVAATEPLIRVLRQRHLVSAQDLRSALGVSAPTLMRLVRGAGEQVLSIGRARRSAYAARRPLRGSLEPLPLYRVDRAGRAEHIAQLHLAWPTGTWVDLLRGADELDWPLAGSSSRMQDGWFEGVPYFLQDMRPQGFLGRQFARAHAAVLQVSDNPEHWSDDDALHALALLGADQSGNFIVGEAAYRLWQDRDETEQAIPEHEVATAYPELARRAMAFGLQGGSSAGGEFPKFGALHVSDAEPRRVLVKFSGSDKSPGTRRWSDLLVCEHLAADIVNTLEGLQGARSRVLRAGNRTFLEVERFDRHGRRGRSGLCSWAAINGDWYGLAGGPWTAAGAALRRNRLIDDATQQAIARLTYFGQLIANTDMHDGNLSFQPAGPQLRVSPVYDMLPMAYRPQVGVELAEIRFAPRLPLPGDREAWLAAAAAAVRFWETAAHDRRISADFRRICVRNAVLVTEARGRA